MKIEKSKPYLDMEAGRELDVLIIENVFGVPRHKVSLPRFSVDIDAAWQVVDKMKDDGLSFVIQYMPKLYYVQFGYGDYYTTAATAPLAICRAALVRCIDDG